MPFDFLYPFCSVPTSWQLPICSLYLWVQFFLKDSTHKWHQEVYVFLGLTFHLANCYQGLSSGKESACQCRRCKKHRFNPWVGKMGDGMATHSSILGWRIPGTKERCGLWSTGSQRVGHNWIDLARSQANSGNWTSLMVSDKESTYQCSRWGINDPQVGKIPWRRKQQPTPVCLPGKSHW